MPRFFQWTDVDISAQECWIMLNNSSKKSKQQKSGTLLINYHFVCYNMLWQILKTWGKLACKLCNLIFKSIQESIRTIMDTKSWLQLSEISATSFYVTILYNKLVVCTTKYFACSAVSERNQWRFSYVYFLHEAFWWKCVSFYFVLWAILYFLLCGIMR